MTKGGNELGEKKHDSKKNEPNIIVNVNCCDQNKESAKPSAFRAVNCAFEQTVNADELVIPVKYPNVVFDLNNEYDPDSSTFSPKQDGIYSITASVNFGPVVNDIIVPTNYRVLIVIRVNGQPVVADNDFFGEIPIGSGISVSAILQLDAEDEVNIAAVSSTNGIFFANPLGMHFDIARLPSPLKNKDPNNTFCFPNSSIANNGLKEYL